MAQGVVDDAQFGADSSVATMETNAYEFGVFMDRGLRDRKPVTSFKRLIKPNVRALVKAGGEVAVTAEGKVIDGRQARVDAETETQRELDELYDSFQVGEEAAGFNIGGVTMTVPTTSMPGEDSDSTDDRAASRRTSGVSASSRASPSADRDDGAATKRRGSTASKASKASWASKLSRLSRRSSRSRGPRQPVAVFWGERNIFASTQPPVIPTSQHQLVLRTLIAALRSQLVPDDSIPTILQPPVGRIDDAYYPDSVKQEHEEYFYNAKLKELVDVDKGFQKQYLRATHYQVQPEYPFDRQVSKKPKLPKKRSQKATMRNGKVSHSWVELHQHADTQKRLRVEHMMFMLTQEQQRELEREKELLTCTREKLDATRERVEQERAEAADWMMRIAQDYNIISGLTAGEYLQATIAAAGKADDEEVVARRAATLKLEAELDELKTYKRQPLAELYKTIPKTGYTDGYSIGKLGPDQVAAALQARYFHTRPTLKPPPSPPAFKDAIHPSHQLGKGTWYATKQAPPNTHEGRMNATRRATRRRAAGRSQRSARTLGTSRTATPAFGNRGMSRATSGISSRQTLRSSVASSPPRTRPGSRSGRTSPTSIPIRSPSPLVSPSNDAASTTSTASTQSLPDPAEPTMPLTSPSEVLAAARASTMAARGLGTTSNSKAEPRSRKRFSGGATGSGKRYGGATGSQTKVNDGATGSRTKVNDGATGSRRRFGGARGQRRSTGASTGSLRSKHMMGSVSMPSLTQSSRMTSQQRQALHSSSRFAYHAERHAERRTQHGATAPTRLRRSHSGVASSTRGNRSTRAARSSRSAGRGNQAVRSRVKSAAEFVPKPRPADMFADDALQASNERTRERLVAERAIPKHSYAVRDIVTNHPRLRPPRRSETVPVDAVGNKHRHEWRGNVMLMKRMTNAPSDAKRYSYLLGRRCL